MPDQAFAGARGVRVFLSSLPGQARPGPTELPAEEEAKDVYERDRDLRERLVTYLHPLSKTGRLTLWHDGMLKGGKRWRQEITGHLEAAQIILLLLSSEFINSPFCFAQMEQALRRQEKGAQVIPVYLRPILNLEDFPVHKLAFLPTHGRPICLEQDLDRACYEVATGLSRLLPGADQGASTRSIATRSLSSDRQPRAILPERPPVPRSDALLPRAILPERPPVPRSDALLPRAALVEAIYQRLTRTDNTAGLVLTGLSGIGKTTLAALIYYHAEEQWRAGRGPFSRAPLWFDIRPSVALADIVSSLGGLSDRPAPLPAEMAATALAEALFALLECADRLVVFDQCETWLDPQSGQARPAYTGVDELLALLNAGSPEFSGRLLLSSHFYPQRLLQYGEATCLQQYKTPRLETSEGVQLLRMGQVPAIVQAAPGELVDLVERCQGHPQTLAWLRQLCKRDAGLALADVVQQRRSAERWMDELLFRTLDAIYTGQLTPEQRKILQGFAVYREAVPLEAALAVAGTRRTRAAANDAVPLVLLDLELLQAFDGGFYCLHPVVANVVQKKIGAAAQRAAHLKAAHYYQKQFQLSMADGMDMSTEKALHGRETFQPAIEAVWHLCRGDRRDEAYRLVRETGLFRHLQRWGYNSTLLVLYLELLSEPDWPAEPLQAARIHNELGEIRNALGQKDAALQEYQRALDLFRRADEPEGIVEALNNLGAMCRVLHAYERARACYQEALHICAETPRTLPQQGTTFNNLGRLAYDLGNQARLDGNLRQARTCYDEALTSYQQALAWFEANELGEEVATALNHLGDAHLALEQSEQARTYYWRALRRFQEHGDRRGEGLSLSNLGLLYQNLARQQNTRACTEEARACYEQALRLFRETDDRWEERIVLRNLGNLYLTYQVFEERQRYRASLACFLLARDIAKELHQQQEIQLPVWLTRVIQLWSVKANETYEAFMQEVAEQAEEIITALVDGGDETRIDPGKGPNH